MRTLGVFLPLIVALLMSTVLGVAVSKVAATAERCKSGYVWRERFEGDAVCVTPDQRYKLENGYCRSGYVWRDSYPGDGVCVTPAQRAAAKAKKKECQGQPKSERVNGVCFF